MDAWQRWRRRRAWRRGQRRVSWSDAVSLADVCVLPDDERDEMIRLVRIEMGYKWPDRYAPDGAYIGPVFRPEETP